jgi:hypothetical protein
MSKYCGTKESATRAAVPPAIGHTYLDQDVTRRGLSILYEYVEIAIFVKDSRIEQLVFRVVAAAPPVCFYKIAVGIRSLRILIEILHV